MNLLNGQMVVKLGVIHLTVLTVIKVLVIGQGLLVLSLDGYGNTKMAEAGQ